MASKSVTTKHRNADIPGSEHDLWLSSGTKCVTVRLHREGSAFPACSQHLGSLHETILGLGKAVEIIATQIEEGAEINTWNMGLALNAIADAIVLNAGLADAINEELHAGAAA